MLFFLLSLLFWSSLFLSSLVVCSLFVVSFSNDESKYCFDSDGTLLPGFTYFVTPKHFNHIFHFFDISGFGGIICQIWHILNLAFIVL